MTRISTRMQSEGVTRSILLAQQRVFELERGLADGRRLHVPSDDPLGARLSLAARGRLRTNEQYQRNLDHGISHLSTTDSVLLQIEDAVATARTLQARGGDDSLGAAGRRALADELDQTLRGLFELGNDQFSGVFLFTGSKSLTPPLVAETDDAGRIVAIQAPDSAAEKPAVRQVDQDVFLRIRLRATDVFGEDLELFAGLLSLRDALEANDGDQVRALTSDLDAAQDQISSAHAVVGSLLERGEAVRKRLEQDEVSYTADRSRVEDLDMARAVTELQQNQVALEAALSTGSRLLNVSLLDYLS